MIIRNIKDAEAALLPFVPLVKQLTGKDMTLRRMWPLMELLGSPQDKLRVIHIAGTSGKTSTAYYLSAMLTEAGQKTGLTVSPHIDSITERVQINGRPLREADFCELLGRFLDIVERVEQKPSYFELMYGFAIWVFAEKGVDYAVVETGMGGLHDATNLTRRADKLCVITDIGFDHMHVLGHSLPEITAQKAGIIHQSNTVIMYRQADEVMDVIEKQVAEKAATLHIAHQAELETGLPAYQSRNWQLACTAYRYLAKRDGLPDLDDEQLRKSRTISIPGRMDRMMVGGKTVIMDGAHNEQKMRALVDSFRELYPRQKPAVLIALKDGKECQDVAPLLAPLANRVITTIFDTTQDLPARSMDPAELAKAFPNAEAIPNQAEAIKSLLKGPEEICLITGSFYLLSQIRNAGSLT